MGRSLTFPLVSFLVMLGLWFPTSVRAQWVYLTRSPGNCAVDFDATILQGAYAVVLHAPDHGSATGVYFRLSVDGLGDEDAVVVTPESGVTAAGDIRTGMILTFSPRTLWHAPLASLAFVDNAPASPLFGSWIFASVRDAVLSVPGGTLPMEDMDAFRVHCNGPNLGQLRASARHIPQ